MDFKCTKKQMRTKLLIAFILAMACFLLIAVINKDEKLSIVVWILTPFLLTWSCMAILIDIRGYFEDALKPWFVMLLYLFTLRWGSAFRCLFQPFIWVARSLVYSVKAVVWAFSGDDE